MVVVKHTGSGSIEIIGLPAGTYGIRYTTGNGTAEPSTFDQTISNQTISDGQSVSYNMPAAGVSTVFDIDYLDQPEPPPEGDTFAGGGFASKLLLLN